MLDKNRITLTDLIGCTGALRVLMALAQVDQAYQFQLTIRTGHHSRTLKLALEMLMKARLVRIVPGKVRIRNTGNFYALTPHGRAVATALRDLANAITLSK